MGQIKKKHLLKKCKIFYKLIQKTKVRTSNFVLENYLKNSFNMEFASLIYQFSLLIRHVYKWKLLQKLFHDGVQAFWDLKKIHPTFCLKIFRKPLVLWDKFTPTKISLADLIINRTESKTGCCQTFVSKACTQNLYFNQIDHE